MAKKHRSCVFLEGLMCSHRRSKRFSIAKYCFSCPHYLKFMREMDAEDEREMAEIDEIMKTGVWS
jgi:hypothetical protein